MRFWKIEKLFFSSEVVLLHQTIIKEWLMFHGKILASTVILKPSFKIYEKYLMPTFILTPTFIIHLRVCKMIIYLGGFFLIFRKCWFFGPKMGKGTNMVQNWQKALTQSIWGTTCDIIVIFSMFVILVFSVRFRHFFIFQKF